MDVPEHAANMLATLALDLAEAELQVLGMIPSATVRPAHPAE